MSEVVRGNLSSESRDRGMEVSLLQHEPFPSASVLLIVSATPSPPRNLRLQPRGERVVK